MLDNRYMNFRFLILKIVIPTVIIFGGKIFLAFVSNLNVILLTAH